MSYDIYCYKSQSGTPDLEEAQEIIEFDEEEDGPLESDPETQLKIAKALLAFDPLLECAEFEGISSEEVRKKFDHIELNSREGELAIQLTIFSNNVAIAIPYWYTGENEITVFKKAAAYTKVIRQTAGYFVYDPQTDLVFDPLTEILFDVDIYSRMTRHTESMKAKEENKTGKKPWWKFW